jgi:hypothetical protein
VEVNVTECVVGVFNATLPKATLDGLILSAEIAAFNCKRKLSVTPPAFASRVAVLFSEVDDTFAVNAALLALAGTLMEAGTVTAPLVLDRLTLSPPAGAAWLSVTRQESVPEPV